MRSQAVQHSSASTPDVGSTPLRETPHRRRRLRKVAVPPTGQPSPTTIGILDFLSIASKKRFIAIPLAIGLGAFSGSLVALMAIVDLGGSPFHAAVRSAAEVALPVAVAGLPPLLGLQAAFWALLLTPLLGQQRIRVETAARSLISGLSVAITGIYIGTALFGVFAAIQTPRFWPATCLITFYGCTGLLLASHSVSILPLDPGDRLKIAQRRLHSAEAQLKMLPGPGYGPIRGLCSVFLWFLVPACTAISIWAMTPQLAPYVPWISRLAPALSFLSSLVCLLGLGLTRLGMPGGRKGRLWIRFLCLIPLLALSAACAAIPLTPRLPTAVSFAVALLAPAVCLAWPGTSVWGPRAAVDGFLFRSGTGDRERARAVIEEALRELDQRGPIQRVFDKLATAMPRGARRQG